MLLFLVTQGYQGDSNERKDYLEDVSCFQYFSNHDEAHEGCNWWHSILSYSDEHKAEILDDREPN